MQRVGDLGSPLRKSLRNPRKSLDNYCIAGQLSGQSRLQQGRWGCGDLMNVNEMNVIEMRSVLVKTERMGELAIITQKTEANI